MRRRNDAEDNRDDDLELDEDPVDPDDQDEDATLPCPHCHLEIHEDSERCPYCGTYVWPEDSPTARKPWWVIIGVIACLYVVYRWVVLK